MMLISYLFFFAIYSVLGWIYETVLCSIEAGHTVNRGFLNGPYCPIYGFGAVLFLILLDQIPDEHKNLAVGAAPLVVGNDVQFVQHFFFDANR